MAAAHVSITSRRPAPWEAVPAHEQLFVLVTGANSGIGLGTAERLIDEFLETRSLTSHLIVIPTTRSDDKSLQCIASLRQYTERAAKTSTTLEARVGDSYRWQDTVARVHILSLVLDLCDLRAVNAFANNICNGVVSNPDGLLGEYLKNVKIPRLDTVLFNAAYGGWAGFSLPRALWIMATTGLVQTATWPSFKESLPTCILNEKKRYNYPDKPLLGEVFCACVFGHYVLAHQLLPLLSRESQTESPGRIVWSSSIEALRDAFNIDDPQCFLKPAAYESAKRLSDIIALTYSLPSVRPHSGPYLRMDEQSGGDSSKTPIPPKMYVVHPGVVASSLFPVPWFLFWAYELVLMIARWMNSPWHNVDGYRGAKVNSWIALEDQAVLDEMGAERIKWGSSCDRNYNSAVKKTEVQGWGWEGKPETEETIAADTEPGVLHKSKGRRLGLPLSTQEDIIRFEEEGVKVWQELERLRHLWAKIIAEEDSTPKNDSG